MDRSIYLFIFNHCKIITYVKIWNFKYVMNQFFVHKEREKKKEGRKEGKKNIDPCFITLHEINTLLNFWFKDSNDLGSFSFRNDRTRRHNFISEKSLILTGDGIYMYLPLQTARWHLGTSPKISGTAKGIRFWYL